MRRIVILLAMVLIPAGALAAPDTPYDVETMMVYPMLSQEQQELFDLMYGAAREGVERLELPKGALYDDAAVAVKALMDDCPELAALDSTCSIGYLQNEPDYATYISFSYGLEIQRQEELIAIAQAWARDAAGDDFAREAALHDRLCDFVTYDADAQQQHNAWGALGEGSAVCDGYAKAMALLLRMADIPCGVVYGRVQTDEGSMAHAWNILCIDGVYTMTDTTYDDQETMVHWFFNLTDEDMALTYIPDGTYAFPECVDASVSWYARTGNLVTGMEDVDLAMMEGLSRLIQTGEPIELRFAREDDYRAVIESIREWIGRYNAQCPEEERVTEGLALFTEENLRCMMLVLPAAPGAAP